MTIKSLITTAIVYSLIQVCPASAGIVMQNSASDKIVLAKPHNDCNAQDNKKTIPALWNQILVDLNKGESITNVFDVFKASDLATAAELRGSLDYDTISAADIQNCNINEVPIPAAGWLFASALLGFITFSNRHRV